MSQQPTGRATLDWLGCATFRLIRDDLVVFLDAYIDRVPSAPSTGVTTADIDRADWIVVGHSHFDHLWGAERVARQTGATIVGSYESIRIMAEQGVPTAQLMPVSGGERIQLTPEVTVSVWPSLHSCIWTHASFSQPDQVCLGDLGIVHQERLGRLDARRDQRSELSDDICQHLRVSNQGARGDGGALVYRFETPEGSLLYQDTCGHWSGVLRELQSDVAILAAAGRGNTDRVRGPRSRHAAAATCDSWPPRRLAAGRVRRDQYRTHPCRRGAGCSRHRPGRDGLLRRLPRLPRKVTWISG
jgi:L-ascorbate metabolism protein UlaG (beta-lactamase superfamily)